MELTNLPLADLHPHPANSNVMPPTLLTKLRNHIADTGRYPPVLVRPYEHAYQILDGHHRVLVLRQLGHATARCVVWDVNDDDALLLLATLNRLQGHDDPRKRAALVAQLHNQLDLKTLAARLPEDRDRLKNLMLLSEANPPPRPPQPLSDMPVAVYFFLLPSQRDALEAKLRETGRPRESALLHLCGLPPTPPLSESASEGAGTTPPATLYYHVNTSK